MAKSRKDIIKTNIGKINKNIKMLEEKKKSIDQKICQLKKAREKLVVNLQKKPKFSETNSENLIVQNKRPNHRFGIAENKNSTEKLLFNFLDDLEGDVTVREANEITEIEIK